MIARPGLTIGFADYGLLQAKSPIAKGYQKSAGYLVRALQADPRVNLGNPPLGGPVLHYVPPHRLNIREGYRNVVFTMWEGERLPPEYVRSLGRAHAHVVPSTFCANVWRTEGLGSPFVAPLGVDLEVYGRPGTERPRFRRGPNSEAARLRERARTQGRLRFLFLGSQIKRKGWHLLAPAWKQAFASTAAASEVQLYVKVIAAEEKAQEVKSFYKGGVVVDSRPMSEAALAELYSSADVFVCPSLSEGFGLPALEALASGCLLISSRAGGLSEFVGEDNAYVLERTERAQVDYAGQKFDLLAPSVQELAEKLWKAYAEWGSSETNHLRRVGWFQARAYRWELTAQKVLEACFAPAQAGRIVRVG